MSSRHVSAEPGSLLWDQLDDQLAVVHLEATAPEATTPEASLSKVLGDAVRVESGDPPSSGGAVLKPCADRSAQPLDSICGVRGCNRSVGRRSISGGEFSRGSWLVRHRQSSSCATAQGVRTGRSSRIALRPGRTCCWFGRRSNRDHCCHPLAAPSRRLSSASCLLAGQYAHLGAAL